MFGYIKGQTVLGCQSMQKAEELAKVEVFSLPAKQIKQRILNYQRTKSNAQVDGEPARGYTSVDRCHNMFGTEGLSARSLVTKLRTCNHDYMMKKSLILI